MKESYAMPKNCLKKFFLNNCNIFSLFIILFAIFCLNPVAARAEVGPVAGEATFHSDYNRSSVYSETSGLPTKKAWTKSLRPFGSLFKHHKTEYVNTPVISDGVIYVGSRSGKFHATDLLTKKTVWKFKARSQIDAPATVSGNLVCFGTTSGVLFCLEKKTGKELWRFKTNSEIVSSPVITEDTVFVSSSDSRLYSIDRVTGKRRWTYKHRTETYVSPRLYSSSAYAKGNLITLFNDGWLVSLDAESGMENWKKKVIRNQIRLERGKRTPLIHSGLVYVVDERGVIVAYDALTGEEKKRYDILKARDFLISDSSLIIAGKDRLLSLSISSGRILWNTKIERGEYFAFSLAGKHLFVLTNYTKKLFLRKTAVKELGKIEAYELRRGKLVWGVKVSSPLHANMAFGSAHMALVTSKGKLRVYKTN